MTNVGYNAVAVLAIIFFHFPAKAAANNEFQMMKVIASTNRCHPCVGAHARIMQNLLWPQAKIARQSKIVNLKSVQL